MYTDKAAREKEEELTQQAEQAEPAEPAEQAEQADQIEGSLVVSTPTATVMNVKEVNQTTIPPVEEDVENLASVTLEDTKLGRLNSNTMTTIKVRLPICVTFYR